MKKKLPITKQIETAINGFAVGHVFSFHDFRLPKSKSEAAIKCLNRMAALDKIKKLSKGKFFKHIDNTGVFIVPTPAEIAKDLLQKNGEIMGYFTGFCAFEELALLQQDSKILLIGQNKYKATLSRGGYTIKFIRQKNTITQENIHLLALLDAIGLVKKEPLSCYYDMCSKIGKRIRKLSKLEVEMLFLLYAKYPPSTGVLLQEIIDKGKIIGIIEKIKDTTNPLTDILDSLGKPKLKADGKWYF